MKIIYSRPNTHEHGGGVSVVHPLPKEQIESWMGKLTEEEYRREVWNSSVPVWAINPVWVEDSVHDCMDFSKRDDWYQDGATIKIRGEAC